MSDADALEWLDRLLGESDERRAASLSEIARNNPQLHARLTRLLASALSPEQSRLLVQPVAAGMESLQGQRDARTGRGRSAGRIPPDPRARARRLSVVWLAERADGVVKREVALKMPMFVLRGAGDVERFTRERDALASLSHANVARLYDAGVLPSGQPFIVIEYVDGTTLRNTASVTGSMSRRACDFFCKCSRPWNTRTSTWCASGPQAFQHPGRCRRAGEAAGFRHRQALGEREPRMARPRACGRGATPLYAAPEQIRGAPSTHTDIIRWAWSCTNCSPESSPYRVNPSLGTRPTLMDVLEALGRGELPRASPERARPPSPGARRRSRNHHCKSLRLEPDQRYARWSISRTTCVDSSIGAGRRAPAGAPVPGAARLRAASVRGGGWGRGSGARVIASVVGSVSTVRRARMPSARPRCAISCSIS